MTKRNKTSNYKGSEKKVNETFAQYSANAAFLFDDEKDKGYARTLRYTYFHSSCQGTTTMSDEIAIAFAKDPQFHSDLYCCKCTQHFPANQFLWSGSNISVGT